MTKFVCAAEEPVEMNTICSNGQEDSNGDFCATCEERLFKRCFPAFCVGNEAWEE